jgi:SAM-dependent methyltransferase
MPEDPRADAACHLTPATDSTGLLGDTAGRDYSGKLRQFAAFAEPELRHLIETLNLRPGMRILDAGCGTGEALPWLLEKIKPSGQVIGIDLSAAHVNAARRHAGPQVEVRQGDLSEGLAALAGVDFIWCVNTINHLRNPMAGMRRLTALLNAGGRVALGQSSLLPDMYFAWDSRLERVTNEAVRRYYLERYSLQERDLAPVRALVGVMRAAGLKNVVARTVLIERVSPVDAATERYLADTLFRDTWGERLRPYLTAEDFAELARLCDPQHSSYALHRPDFHFLQSFTLVTGEIQAAAHTGR